MTADRTGTHQAHCCDEHGCKYGDSPNCPVEQGTVKQDGPCETCEAMFGDGGYEFSEGVLVWRPSVRDILVKVARQLGPRGKGKLTPNALAELQYAARAIRFPPRSD